MAPPLGARRRVDPRQGPLGGGQTAEAPVERRADGSLVLTRAQYRQVGTGLPATPLPKSSARATVPRRRAVLEGRLHFRAAHATRCYSPCRSRIPMGLSAMWGCQALLGLGAPPCANSLGPRQRRVDCEIRQPGARPAVRVADRAMLPPAHGHGNFPPAVARFFGSGATCGDAGFGRGAGPTMRHRLRRAKPRSARFGRRAALDERRATLSPAHVTR